ncbi:MAG: hypothetical protein RR092_07105, partial [Oscillospiraceae bacterium]
METFRLKNIILVILALVNVFLLASLLSRQSAERSAYQEAVSQLSQLFQGDGIELRTDRIPKETPHGVMTLTRDTAAEGELAAALLGDEVTYTDQGGGVSLYTSSIGTALFRLAGDFDATLSLPLEQPEAYCAKLCRRFGYGDLTVDLQDGFGTLCATRYFADKPVVNATLTFTLVSHVLVSVSGRQLPEGGVESDTGCLSALSALTRFQQSLDETGAICSVVLDMEPGYLLQSTPAVPLSLVP